MESRRSAGTGWRKVLPGSQLVCLPVADGAKARSKHSFMRLTVRFTLKHHRTAWRINTCAIRYFRQPNPAVIELAQASGLELVSPVQRLPFIRRRLALANLFSPPWNTY